jgi:hypothetical protein
MVSLNNILTAKMKLTARSEVDRRRRMKSIIVMRSKMAFLH